METLLLWGGRVAGTIGALICIVAIAARLSGQFFVLTMQTGTLLLAGMAMMLMGCVGLLLLLTRRR